MRICLIIAFSAITALALPSTCLAERADWAAKPTPEELVAAYPTLAAALGIEGYARIHCDLAATGVIESCRLLEERPKGLGFGEASLGLAHLFRTTPSTGLDAHGRQGGGDVQIPLAFRLPPSPTDLPSIGPPISNDGLALARQLIAARGIAAENIRGSDAWLAKLLEASQPELEPDIEADAVEALRQGEAEAVAEQTDLMARLYAANLTSAQIRSALSYELSAPVATLKAHREDIELAQKRFIEREGPRMWAGGRTQFCLRRDCTIPAVDLARAPAEPMWTEQPTDEQVAAVTPFLSRLFLIPGYADLTCRVDSFGLLKACKIDRESPADLGFGRAALILAGYRRVARPTDAAALRFRVTFAAADLPALSAAAVQRPTTRAFAIARRVAEVQGVVDGVRSQSEDWLGLLAKDPLLGVSDRARADAISALRAEVALHTSGIVDEIASGYVAWLSEAQLDQMLAYLQNPDAQAERAAGEALRPALQSYALVLTGRFGLHARTHYCQKRDCAGPPPAPDDVRDQAKAIEEHLKLVSPRP